MRRLRAASCLFVALGATLALTGCGEPRTVGNVQVQGHVSTYNYYGEFREEKRIYLLRSPEAVHMFSEGVKEMPQSKTMIGKGPNRETLVIETVKDNEVSKVETARLIRTFNARNNANVLVP